MDFKTGQVVYTNKAHCRDCYRCLRVCPVKAIRMEDGQAYVVRERCISCGTCIRECPQGAKQFRDDVDRAIKLIRSGETVAVSVAPSFAAIFMDWEQKRLASALRKLGFAYVGETAVGAYHVAKETAEICKSQPNKSHICSACPAVVSYIERYQPEKTSALVQIMSPMLAHARLIKEKLGRDAKVIFIGPCVAKKSEAERPEYRGLVDCVLTFTELQKWFERENIDLAACEESRFNEEPMGDARYFPLVGGSVKTSELDTDMLSAGVISASGFSEVVEALDIIKNDTCIIEPLFCPQGCVNGPALSSSESVYHRRREVLDYAAANKGARAMAEPEYVDMAACYKSAPIDADSRITEEQIREVLEKTGKGSLENQLNCGACGYSSCREKAVAVINGMAELEMCIPQMRRLAEQRTDRIIETSPNGIIILDEHLNMIHMNPAFRSFFMCSEAVLGRRISYLMDSDPFEKLAAGNTDIITMVARHERYNILCHQILYALPEEKQYVGIFVDITKNKQNKEKLDQLRAQTVNQAKELLEHQINMAQKIARFLGESTAQGESLLDKLMLIAGGENGEENGGNEWLKDIYTSK